MKRAAFPFLILALLCALAAQAAPLATAERDASIAYVRSLQNSDGGFRPTAAAGPSQLGATSSSLRAFKYFGGEVPNSRGTRAFILSCYDSATGGFSDTPGGTPDVRSTAMGLMAMTELKMPLKQNGEKIRDYLSQNAVTTPDVYIAAAALEPTKLKTVKAPLWITRFDAIRRPDGSFGDGPVDTATAIITTLRLGGTFDNREGVLNSLRSAQGSDGGFGVDGKPSDMGTTYRLMRAFWMIRGEPDVARVREFVAKCRNADGGYGPTPGQPSNASTTYFAAIVQKWADEMEGIK